MELDLSSAGKWTGTLKLRTYDPPKEGGRWGFATFDGLFIKDDVPTPQYRKVAVDSTQNYAKYLEVGKERDVEISWRPSLKNENEMWVQLWRSTTPGMGKKGGFGGGGRAPTPEEIHAGPLAAIIASVDAPLDEKLARYWAEMKSLGGAKVETVPPAASARPSNAGTKEAMNRPPAKPVPTADELKARAKAIFDEMGASEPQKRGIAALCKGLGMVTSQVVCEGYDKGFTSVETLRVWIENLEVRAA